MKRYWLGVIGVASAYLKRFWRDKTALFFTFLFPLIFLFVFGSIFNKTDISFNVALLNHSDSQFASGFVSSAMSDKTFKINKDIKDIDTAKQRMSRGEIDSIIELPKHFGEANASGKPSGSVVVYTKKGAEQSGQTVAAVMEAVLADINKKMGQPDAPLTVEQKSTGQEGLSQFDYTFSGLLGFSLMSMAIFGLANSMPQEKKTGTFRRLKAAPFRASQLLLANGLFYLTITLLSILLMFIIGIVVFHFQIRGSWWVVGGFTVLSAIMLVGLGLAIGGWAKNENQSAPVSNLVSFPMMFLSGTFFPRFMFPEWMQSITGYLPLTPVIDGLRVAMTENASVIELLPQIGLISLWAVIIFGLAIRLFRWE